MEVSSTGSPAGSGRQAGGQGLDTLADVWHGDGFPESGAGGRSENVESGISGAVGVQDASIFIEIEAEA
ncbi:hypothetical protein D3C72_2252900 [compost metagenome]